MDTTTYEYGLSISSTDDGYAVYRNGKPCVTGLLKPVTFKTLKAAENYVAKQVKASAADEALGEDGRKALREEREAKEAAEKAERDAAFDERLRRERAQKEARQNRAILNSFLRGHGYTWKKFENDEEDIDMGGLPPVEWDLWSPDNRIVSVQEAMQELAYQDVKFAHEWLASRNIAEQVPAIEKKRQEEAAKVQEVESAEYTEEQIAYQSEAIPAFIEAGLTPEVAEREAKRLSLPHRPWEDNIRLEPVRLPTTDASLVIDGDFRYGVMVGDEWCGIDEIMERYPTVDLSEYAERNRKRAS